MVTAGGTAGLFSLLPCLCIGLFYAVIFSVVIASFVFWIMMLIEVCTKEPSENNNDKVIWLLVVIFAHGIGALLYYFIRRPERKKKYGA
jgi:hypothetical protein